MVQKLECVFAHRLYIERLDKKGPKESIAFALSYAVVSGWQFDSMAAILKADETVWCGDPVTARVAGGGSKVSIKLFSRPA